MSSWDPLICAHIVSPSSFLLTHYTSINSRQGMRKKKKKDVQYCIPQKIATDQPIAGEDAEVPHLPSIQCRPEYKMALSLGKTAWAVSFKNKYILTIQSNSHIPVHSSQRNEDLCLHKDLLMDGHSSFICDSQILGKNTVCQRINNPWYLYQQNTTQQ